METATVNDSSEDFPTRPAPRRAAEKVGRPLSPGHRVGEYRIESLIARGGCSAVYEAVHPLIGRRAAIKVLDRWLSERPDTSARFLAEARASIRIGHPNIVDIFGFGRLADGRLYSQMEHLDGKSLAEVLRHEGPRSVDEAFELFEPVALALEAAHAHAVIHRDIKPDNIILLEGADGVVRPKLIDFGVARILVGDEDLGQKGTRVGAVIGTPGWMAPEQARGQPVDSPADVYALGVVLYQMLTGLHPFIDRRGYDTKAILRRQARVRPRPPSQHRPGLPASIDDLLDGLLAFRPEDRPTLHEAIEAFREVVLLGLVESTMAGVELLEERDTPVVRPPSERLQEEATDPLMNRGTQLMRGAEEPTRGKRLARWLRGRIARMGL